MKKLFENWNRYLAEDKVQKDQDRAELHQLIHEELERKIANKPIPVEELTWTGEELKLHSAKGEDHWSTVRTPEALEAWKATVLSHGPGSTVVLNKHGRWAPAAGPWKEKSDAYRAGKAKTLARWGSSH